MQIVVLDSKSFISDDTDISSLKKLGVLSLYARTDPALIRQRLLGADIVLTNRTVIYEDAIRNANNLKCICILGNDFSVVDMRSAVEKGVTVCCIPEYASQDIAQHTLALLMEMSSHVGLHNQRIHNGAWCASQDFCWWEREPVPLYGKTAGIIGLGKVSRILCNMFAALGIHTIGYDEDPKAEFPGRRVSMEELLKTSDIISLHCSVRQDTVSFVDRELILRMKKGVLLLNTASGKLINESDVCSALKEGLIGGYAADTVFSEPISVHNPLLQAPNCILSGHCSCAGVHARQKLIETAADTVSAFLSGTPINQVYQ